MRTLAEYFDNLDEKALTPAQRMKRRQAFRRSAAKREAGIKRSKFKKASPEKIKKRARKLAIKSIKQKMAKGKSLATLSDAERIGIERRLEKKKGLIDRLARKAIRIVRKKEIDRLRSKSG